LLQADDDGGGDGVPVGGDGEGPGDDGEGVGEGLGTTDVSPPPKPV